jgi:hypothetical protein
MPSAFLKVALITTKLLNHQESPPCSQHASPQGQDLLYVEAQRAHNACTSASGAGAQHEPARHLQHKPQRAYMAQYEVDAEEQELVPDPQWAAILKSCRLMHN